MKLRHIIAEFLADLTYAQHRANELSRRLSCKYRHDRLLRYFPVPNAELDEAVVTLRFAPREEEGAVPPSPDDAPRCPPEPHPLLALRLARTVVEAVTERLARDVRGADGSGAGQKQKLADALTSDRVAGALAGRLRPRLQAFLEQAVTTGPSDALLHATLAELGPPLADALAEDDDLRACIPDLPAAVAGALGEHAVALRAALARAGAVAQALSDLPESVPPIDVVMDGASLARFPDHAIHTLTLTAKLRNYKWVVVEREGALVEEELVVEQ